MVGRQLEAVGAHRSHYSVLAALQEFGPSSQAELGRRCSVDRSDMVALLDELSGAGHVRRTPDPDDRRRNVVTLTATGRRRLDRLDRVVTAAQDELLAPLSATERRQLVDLLARL